MGLHPFPARCANPVPCAARGRDRCRHFVLDQLPDGRYVILGEQSAHAALADLLRHYATAPLAPYHEVLTVPCRRVRTWALVSPCSREKWNHWARGGIFPSWGNPSTVEARVGSGATLAVGQHPQRRQHTRGRTTTLRSTPGHTPSPAPLPSYCRKGSPKEGRRPPPAAVLCIPHPAKHQQSPWCTAPWPRGSRQPGRWPQPPCSLRSPAPREAHPGR